MIAISAEVIELWISGRETMWPMWREWAEQIELKRGTYKNSNKTESQTRRVKHCTYQLNNSTETS